VTCDDVIRDFAEISVGRTLTVEQNSGSDGKFSVVESMRVSFPLLCIEFSLKFRRIFLRNRPVSNSSNLWRVLSSVEEVTSHVINLSLLTDVDTFIDICQLKNSLGPVLGCSAPAVDFKI
jgi:hypothetical protein